MGLEAVAAALVVLRDEAARAVLELDVAGASQARALRDGLVAQVEDYLLPRLREIDAPLLAVVGGSTGAGKSTLVNSLVGVEVSPAGVRRPTTRAPVLVCNPLDLPRFASERVLPGLARRTGGGAGGPGELSLVPSESLPPGFALLDAPDVDSVVVENRALASQLLAAADLWLFVTTAARYADAVPWALLREARDRATSLAVVLDRVPEEAAEVREHLLEMLAAEGLGGTPVLLVPEVPQGARTPDGDPGAAPEPSGLLPGSATTEVRAWVGALSADAQARADVVRRTLDGALASLEGRTTELADAVAVQAQAAEGLAEIVTGSYAAARVEVEDAVRGGTLLHGEVLARWQELVGTGELMRGVQAGVARARDRLRAAVTGRPAPARAVEEAVEGTVAVVVRSAAERAAARVTRAWSHDSAGTGLLPSRASTVSEGFAGRVAEEVRSWQGEVVALVEVQARSKRAMARLASFSVNGAGLVVMLAVFAHTGGLLGGEVAVAGGTSALGQVVLEAILGDQAVRTLADQARAALVVRVEALLAEEQQRFLRLVEPRRPRPDAEARLRAAGRAVARARTSP